MDTKVLSIKQIRVLNDYTQEEMAKVIGNTQGTYSQKELGKIKWQVEDIIKVGQEFDLDLNLLKELQP